MFWFCTGAGLVGLKEDSHELMNEYGSAPAHRPQREEGLCPPGPGVPGQCCGCTCACSRSRTYNNETMVRGQSGPRHVWPAVLLASSRARQIQASLCGKQGSCVGRREQQRQHKAKPHTSKGPSLPAHTLCPLQAISEEVLAGCDHLTPSTTSSSSTSGTQTQTQRAAATASVH